MAVLSAAFVLLLSEDSGGKLLFCFGRGMVSESAFEPTPRCPLSYSAIGCVCLET